jgi:autoinducer-2 kinase
VHLVTLDIGTGGLHVVVYDTDGRLLADTYKAIGYASDARRNTLTFNPDRLFDRAMRLVRETFEKAEIPDEAAVVFAITGQRHGSVFLDSAMNPVLSVANLDGRVDAECVEQMRPHRTAIYDICGRLPSEIFPAMRMRWMARHQPDIHKRIRGFLMINEWFAYRLCGKPFAEKTSVSESLLFDVRTQRWSDEMIDLFGQSSMERWDIVDPGTIVGTITDDVARTYSFPKDSMISLGAGDTQCAVAGSRAFHPGDIVVVNGSTTPVVMVTEELVFDPLCRTWADLSDGSRYLIESNAGKTGMVYRDITDILSCRNLPEADISSIRDAQTRGIHSSLIPDPFRPVDFLNYRSSIEFGSDPVAMLRLLPYLMLENTAFAVAANIDEVRRVAPGDVHNVYLTGGSSRSVLTRNILSVLLEECPLFLTATYDTTAKGASMMALARWNDDVSLEEVFLETERDSLIPVENTTGTEISRIVRERYEIWCQRFRQDERAGV